MTKTIRVAGQATIAWTAYVPEGAVPNICDDPAVEAVLGAIGQSQDVYIFGEDAEPVHVDLELGEEDVEVEEDDR
jgi:hypothetical protein